MQYYDLIWRPCSDFISCPTPSSAAPATRLSKTTHCLWSSILLVSFKWGSPTFLWPSWPSQFGHCRMSLSLGLWGVCLRWGFGEASLAEVVSCPLRAWPWQAWWASVPILVMLTLTTLGRWVPPGLLPSMLLFTPLFKLIKYFVGNCFWDYTAMLFLIKFLPTVFNLHWWDLPGSMITMMVARGFSNFIIPSIFIIGIRWKEELSLLIYLEQNGLMEFYFVQ